MNFTERELEKITAAGLLVKRNQLILPLLMVLVLLDMAAFLMGIIEAKSFGLLMLLLAALGIRRPWQNKYPSYEELVLMLEKKTSKESE